MPRQIRTRAWIDAYGAASLLAVAIASVLSPFLAATLPAIDPVARRSAWLRDFYGRAVSLPASLGDALHGEGPLAGGVGFVLAYALPLIVNTLCCALLLFALARRRDALTDGDAQRALRWAIAFGVAAVPAFNVLTQDVWLSVAWGRMMQHGMNPFAHAYPMALAADLPLEYDPMPMTYGPLWAVVCGLVVFVTGGAALASWLAFKVVLACAFVVCLWCVSEIARPFGAWRQTFAIVVMGWLPTGVHCGIAEGHNDVVMIAAMLLWLRRLQRRSAAGPLLLTLSILTKYVTAPLALVDVVHHWRSRTMSTRQYAARVLPAFLLLLGGGVLVVSSLGGLSETSAMREWKFLDPADVLRLVARYTGLPIGRAAVPVVALLFGAVTLVEVLRLRRDATLDDALRVSLAIMAFVLLALTGHVWPWFFIWCLPLAALVPQFWLARFAIGAAAVAPFTIMHWTRFDADGAARSELPSLVMYGVALCAAVYRPPPEPTGD